MHNHLCMLGNYIFIDLNYRIMNMPHKYVYSGVIFSSEIINVRPLIDKVVGWLLCLLRQYFSLY